MELHDLGVLDLIDPGPFKSKVSHNQMCDFLKYAVQEQDYINFHTFTVLKL